MKQWRTWLACISIFLTCFLWLSPKVSEPFWGHHEWNGVWYGQIAKNYLRIGLIETKGAQVLNADPFTQDWWIHTHHPATYPLLLAGWFATFGVSEASARILSIVATSSGFIGFFLLLNRIFKSEVSALLYLLIPLTTPLLLYYGSMPVSEILLLALVAFAYLSYSKNLKRENDISTLILLFLILITEWPGFWVVSWLWVSEFFSKRRKTLIWGIPLVGFLAYGLVFGHIVLTHNNSVAELQSIFQTRFSVSAQPYTTYEWFHVLATRTKAFWGLPMLLLASLGIGVAGIKDRAKLWWYITLLAAGWSHIFVFRNITWYHDYMLLHTVPAMIIIGGGAVKFLKNKVGTRLTILLLFGALLFTLKSTQPFFIALSEMEPHKACVETGMAINQSPTISSVTWNSENAFTCPPFTNYYADKNYTIIKSD